MSTEAPPQLVPYLTSERAIERLAEIAALALDAYASNDTPTALELARQAIGFAHHAASLIRQEIELLEATP